jgi:hypothetical protein
VIDQLGRSFRHGSSAARRTQPAPLAREGNEQVIPAARTSGAGEARKQDAALEAATELASHKGQDALSVPTVFSGEREVALQR